MLNTGLFAKSFSTHAFFSYAPRVWNSLPAIIRQATSAASFRKLLKTHYFRHPETLSGKNNLSFTDNTVVIKNKHKHMYCPKLNKFDFFISKISNIHYISIINTKFTINLLHTMQTLWYTICGPNIQKHPGQVPGIFQFFF